ncbi:D-alanine--D-serine ligase VanG [Desulfoscipio sp. XC116]|uniref:D-alanine--D-serine ligase VanG n=1 Tax=Desulfoscipio sp. XC116 TaxID=3144975 RepID=UPI00325BAEBC
MKRLNIAILFGGCSPEYGVSLQSAYSVIKHVDTSKYTPVLIGISSKGDWYRFDGDIEKIAADTWCNPSDCLPAALSPNRSAHTLQVFHSDRIESIPVDAAFPILHGKNGEDGTVQGLFELAGIPLVGCGTLASALCMDKDRAHKLARAAGVRVPNAFVLQKSMDAPIAPGQAASLGYPLFVKPVRAGSSYGITKVFDRHELPAAIKSAFEYDDEVIIEESITGFEVGCAVLGNKVLTVGEIDEIELADGFFNFTEKYTLKTAAIHVPARIPKEKAEEIKLTAKTIYQALGCRGFARVDMFLNAAGKIIFNEVNTIPGFTSHSRYPNMLKSAGISFEQLISSVIELAAGA